MKTLVNILLKETEGLKELFLEKSKAYAEKEYDLMSEKRNWDTIRWCEEFGLTPIIFNEGTPSQRESFPKVKSYALDCCRSVMNNMRTVLSKTREVHITKAREVHITKAVEAAHRHYENSILKLAGRIEKKGLNVSTLKVDTSRIGVNIETVLTDGEKTVRAWTIVAEGEVQRPHYRYLVK